MSELLAQRYEILRPLGSGGMGDVHLARDLRDGREVALKRLRLGDAEAVRRFRDEFSILARIEHPGIVRVFDYGLLPDHEGGGAYFTMEALTGQAIDEAIAPGEIEPLLQAVSDIAAGLDALAAVGLAHCDLKPSNVMIVRDAEGIPRARLLDFGFVGSIAEWSTKVRGTPGYVAPEVLAGGPYTRASDAYALGATLYKVVTGRTAFAGTSASSVVSAQRATRPSGLALRALGTPPALESALLGLLDDEPDRRLTALGELVEIATRHTQRSAVRRATPRGFGGRGLFIGRGAERDRLRAHLFGARTQLGVVRGAIGSGRTRLARELAVEAELGGWSVVWLDTDSPPKARAALGSGLAPGRGLLVVLDDVDRWTQGALAELDFAALRPPLTILATVDVASEGESWTSALLALSNDPRRWDVELPPLPLEEVRQLLASRLGARTPGNLAAFLLRQVGGMPGAVHQALDTLLAAGALTDEGGEWLLDEAAATRAIEAGFATELGTVLSTLEMGDRNLLLRLAFELPPTQPNQGVVQELRWKGWLGEHHDPIQLQSPGFADRVRSELLPAAAADVLGEIERALVAQARTDARGLRLRAEAHQACGDSVRARAAFLAAIRAATGAEDPDGEAAFEAFVPQGLPESLSDHDSIAEVAALDASRGRNRRAADLWGRLLLGNSIRSSAERMDLSARRAQALIHVGDFLGALSTMDAASGSLEDSGFDGSDWWGRRASALHFLGKIDEAVADLEKALALLPEGAEERRARLENRLAMILFLNVDGARGRNMLESAAEHARAGGSERLAAVIEGNFGLMARISGDLVEAEKRQRAAIREHQRIGNEHEAANMLASLASTLSSAARWPEFEQISRQTAELARKRKDPHLLLNITATRILAALRRGLIAEARALQRTERVWLPAIRRLEAELHHKIYLAERFRLEGREGRAKLILRGILESPAELRMQRYTALAEAMIGRLESTSGSLVSAARRLERARDVRPDDRELAVFVDLELARIAWRRPELEEVRAAIARGVSQSDSSNANQAVRLEMEAWGAFSAAHHEAAIERFHDCVISYLQIEHRVLAVEVTQLAGRALAERNREREGAALLHQARDLARSLGLRVWAQRMAEDILEVESRSTPTEASGGPHPPEWDTLHRVSEVLNSALEPERLLPRALALVCDRMGAERGFILLHEAGAEPRPVASYGQVDDETRESALDVSRSVIRKVTTSGESFRADDAKSDPRLGSTLSVLDLSMRSILCTPLRLGDELIGTIYLENRSAAGQFEASHLDLVEAFANLVAVAIQNARLHEQLRNSRDRVLGENLSLRREVHGRFRTGNLVGQSAEMERVLVEIEKVAPSRATVLITGESGTGKDLVAKTIHFASPRADRPFLSLNCAALPANLIEAELFGIEGRVATGVDARPGIFERADGGTLFLDEIGDMPLELQAKLLRVLQEREFSRIGGAKTIKVDVRLLAATNQDLQLLIEQGKFREDLYFRLHILPIHLAPLRERKVDILALAEHFLRRFCEENSLPIPRLSAEYRSTLMRSNWPGNVRELQNYVERSAVMSPGPVLEPVVLPADLEPTRPHSRRTGRQAEESSDSSLPSTLRRGLEDAERRWIQLALRSAKGNQRQAAELLGIVEPTLRYRMKRLGVRFEPEPGSPGSEAPPTPRNRRSQKSAQTNRR